MSKKCQAQKGSKYVQSSHIHSGIPLKAEVPNLSGLPESSGLKSDMPGCDSCFATHWLRARASYFKSLSDNFLIYKMEIMILISQCGCMD